MQHQQQSPPQQQQQRGYWSAEEDALLVASVQRNGRQNWSAVAAQLEGRGSKQCRERWLNYLRDDVKKGPWTDFEKAGKRIMLWLDADD